MLSIPACAMVVTSPSGHSAGAYSACRCTCQFSARRFSRVCYDRAKTENFEEEEALPGLCTDSLGLGYMCLAVVRTSGSCTHLWRSIVSPPEAADGGTKTKGSLSPTKFEVVSCSAGQAFLSNCNIVRCQSSRRAASTPYPDVSRPFVTSVRPS